MQKLAIFDIDGTIFRSSLLIELVNELVSSKIFPAKSADKFVRAREKWLNRQGSYDDYIAEVVIAFESNLRGVPQALFRQSAKRVIARHNRRVYCYTRDLIKFLRAKNYFLLAISNSPLEIVEPFCSGYGFNKVYGRVYETDKNKRYTGATLYLDLISDKAKILKRAVAKESLTLKNSIGIGDSEADIPFLKLVANPICFNPNKKLYQTAKRNNWKVVVERKDVVYFM